MSDRLVCCVQLCIPQPVNRSGIAQAACCLIWPGTVLHMCMRLSSSKLPVYQIAQFELVYLSSEYALQVSLF